MIRDATLDEIKAATRTYLSDIKGFDPELWYSFGVNVALINEHKDVALFERQHYMPSLVMGHYFFQSRGKKARDSAKAFLREIFTGDYNIQAISGLTPDTHKGALWMNKQLGFKEHGTLEHDGELFHLVTLTKKEWENE